MGELRYDGRAVIVTGAGRGVGRAHALLFASRGAHVVVADLGGSMEGGGASKVADEVVAEITAAGGSAVAAYESVADPKGAATIVATAIDNFGRLDVLVNNAGIVDNDRFATLPLEQFSRMTDVHHLGTVYMTRAAWPHFQEAGYGRVVNTTSEAAFGIHPGVTDYGSAKGAVLGFTRTLAAECAGTGINVNAIAPRAQTRMATPEVLAKTMGAPIEAFQNDHMNAYKPELVSPAAAFLAHESCELNGEIFAVGAGNIQRVIIMQSEGITDADLSPEMIADQLGTIMDMTGGHELDVLWAFKQAR